MRSRAAASSVPLPALARSADRLESIDDRALVNAVASVPLRVPAESALLIVSAIRVCGLSWADRRGA